MLSINDLSNGSFVIIDGDPYQVMSVKRQHIGRGGSSVQTKLRNVRTTQVLDRNFKPADMFEEADIEKTPVKFIYDHRGEYWFAEAGKRLALKEGQLGESAKFLKPNIDVTALKFNGQIINIILPIKIDYKVMEAPPAVRGDTAQGGTKVITLEGGLKVSAPLFINEGDIVRVNTETGLYAERMEKA